MSEVAWRRHTWADMPTGLVILLAVPPVVLGALRAFPAQDRAWNADEFHFYVVSGASFAAAFVVALLVFSARSVRETRVLFLALTFFSLAMIFSVHGLTTPGHLYHERTAALVRSPWLSTLAGGVFAALSVVSLPGGMERARLRLPWITFVVLAALSVAYVAVSLISPDWLTGFPTTEPWFQSVLTAVSSGLLGFAAWRFHETYRFARLPGQEAVAVGLLFLVEAQFSLRFGTVYHLSWWLYHFLFMASFLTVLIGWAWEWRRARDVRAIADTLVMRDALAQLARGRPALMVTLANEIEHHDGGTSRHVDRVGTYAYAVGQEMGLRGQRLRDLVLGAQMHDVGKIYIPHHILLKPGKLTPEEYAVIQTHTVHGHDLIQRVPGLARVAELVRHHHERFDGGGYPDRLAGEGIALEARVIAVVDTFDAITAGRPYQAAQPVEAAAAEIRRVSGSQFDPACVAAFERALAKGMLRPAVEPTEEPVLPALAAAPAA